jgi:fibronectin-binding autotransporter adhesin
MIFRYSKACAFLTMTLALAAAAPQTFSATLTVTNLADSGAGTLRNLIAAALPGDTIQFGLSGTISLNSELVLSKSLRINGLTANSLRLTGNNHSRIFNVTSGTAQIFNMTIADGRVAGTNGPTGLNGENVSGGGIRVANGATLDLENCILTNNVALGGQGGPASLSGPAGNGGDGYGGGIASFGTLTMVRCTLAGNSASGGPGGPTPSPGFGGQGRGGGLYLEGSAILFYSTIDANNAVAGSGGAGTGAATGGGIYSAATLNVNTCTIVSNTASGSTTDAGGGIGNVGTLTIRDCTIANNQADFGGGLAGGGNVGNTILAGNSASSLPAGPDANGPIVSNDYNLIQTTDGITFSGLTAHNITGQSPLLGPLIYNGGPDIGYQLQTMTLLSGSPAIDNGSTSGSTDQRGFNRPYDTDLPNAAGGNGGDIGAVEIYPSNLYVINNNDLGAGSLRQAILDNNGLGGGNSIYFSNNVIGAITLTSGSLVMTAPGQIVGPGAEMLAVSGNHNGRIFDIRNGPTSISGLTLRDGLVVGTAGVLGQPGFDERGGGIYSQHILLLSNCVVLSNSVIGGMGGSASIGPGGNGGKAMGGGLHSSGGNLTLAYCLFEGNTCTGGEGGSAANNNGGFGGNGLGGAVSAIGGAVSIIGCELKNGLAKGGDGAIGNPSGVGGQGYGGGLYSESTLAVSGSTIAGNTAAGGGGAGPGAGNGGGAYSFTTWVFTNCTIANNAVTGSSFDSGGGLYNQGSLTIFNSTITANQSDYGGGIYGNTTLGNTIVAGNTAADGPDGSGTFTSENYNLIQTSTGMAINGSTTHNLIGMNPLLGPLTNNGGPTRTCALRAGSPAIDQGKNFGPATDQRGAPRPFDFASITNAGGGDGSDIGTFELGRPNLTIQQFATVAVLYWPSYYSDFILQSVTDINASNSWAIVAGTPVVVASQNVLTNGPILGNRFYRLKGN